MSETTEHGGGDFTENDVNDLASLPVPDPTSEGQHYWPFDKHMARAVLSAGYRLTPPTRGDQAEVARLREVEKAARAVVAAMSGTYRNKKGDLCTLEGDDGERSWIVPQEHIADLEAALSPTSFAEPQAAAPVGDDVVVLKEALRQLSECDGSPENVGSPQVLAARVRSLAIAALSAAAPVTGDRETAGVELTSEQGAMLAEALGNMLVASGMIQPGFPMTGPELIYQAECFCEATRATPPSGGGDHAAEPQAPDGGVGS